MKTLEQFNKLSPNEQCEFIIDLVDNVGGELKFNILIEGEEQGHDENNFIKLILLFRKINKGRSCLKELQQLWLQEVRNDKLNLIL